jgi:hypothetical protein
MKESVDERIANRIKEVMGQYEPDYSPQAWDKLSKQMAMPEFRLKKLLLRFKFWFSVVFIVGVLVLVNKDTDGLLADNNPAVDTVLSEPANFFVSEKTGENVYLKKTTASGPDISSIGVIHEGKNISSKVTSVLITDSLSVTYQNYTQTGYAIREIPDGIEQNPVLPYLLEDIDVGYRYNISHLIPIKSPVEEIPLLKSPSSGRIKKVKLQWPGSIVTEEGSYDKFVGPTKLSVFYSPEIHYNEKKLGISQGAGISVEGPIHSSVSISAGLSYQAINFEVTIFSEKVPPYDLVLQPADTGSTFYYVDSTGIRSGNYKFLELPVAVNFKFLESARSQVWLSAGISAIAFLQQDYTYETIVGGISDSSSVSVKAWENIHPLASFNLGLLYRYQFSDRLFLHGSAQYKQHLVPLGYNSMKLNRLNFQVGITYRFGHKD